MEGEENYDPGEDGLSPEVKIHWLKALSAFETQNFRYAEGLVGAVLSVYPDFAAGKKLLEEISGNLTKMRGSQKKERFDWKCPLCGHISPEGYSRALAGDGAVHCPNCELTIEV